MKKGGDLENFTTLDSRIRWIIQEKNLKQAHFARTVGISANYVYLLTSGRKTVISTPLARLIEGVYGYCAQWVLTGEGPREQTVPPRTLQDDIIREVLKMNDAQLRAVASFLETLAIPNER